MKVCKTIEEFIYEYEVNDCSFNDLTFENEEQYVDLYNYCIINQDKAINLLILGNIFYNGKGVKPNLEKAFYWYEQSAKAGNSKGMRNLAICYDKGEGCTPDAIQAFYWYEQSAKAGNSAGMNSLAIFYEDGKGCTPDTIQAFYWYGQSAKAGNSAGMYFLAFCYEEGIGCTPDASQAFYWYEQSAKAGNSAGMYSLGYCYEEGIGCTPDASQAFYWFEQSAKAGDSAGMYSLAICYEKGTGCIPDAIQTFYWYEQSAKAGNSYGMNELAKCYCKGIGCTPDAIQEFYWNEQSAKEGNSAGMYSLGYCYQKGIGCTPDAIQAFYWYEQSAKAGNSAGMNSLAICYEEGKGCTPDAIQAFYWYEQSAKAGNSYGMKNLAYCYEEGIGCTPDAIQAFYWYEQSAKAGNSAGMNNLAYCYEEGIGCTPDAIQAFYWYEQSAKVGDSAGMNNLGWCYYKSIGCDSNYDLAFSWTKKAADLNCANALDGLGEFYEKGIGCEKDFEKSSQYYKKALDLGLETARESYERVKKLFEEEQSKKDNLHFNPRKDVFISWNHLDKKEKDELFKNLESRNICTVWESDGNGVGNIKETIENAILQAKSYIVILTGNSINSKWVEKEVEIILSKIKFNKDYANVIRPIILNKITLNGQEEEYDVIKGINELDDNSSFKELLNYCASFEDLDGGINFDKIANTIREAISNSLKIEYREKIINNYERFSAALNSVVSSRQTVTGIIAATLEFEKGYLNRSVYDNDDNEYSPSDLLANSNLSMIYGEGGSGKSLYLKNLIRKEFKGDRYIFFVECKELVELVETSNFMEILKNKSFDNYFEKDETQFVSQESFESFVNSRNEIVLLIDALDELLLEKRKKLISKLQVFLNKVPNCKIIFTTRNKNDYVLINTEFHKEVNIYELRGLVHEDLEKLYDNLSSKYKARENKIENGNRNFESGIIREISKDSFFRQLETINDDIKKNPLLISNLIFIYFATNKIYNSSFDITTEAVTILLNDLEEERNISFEYKKYIANNNLYELLGYFAVQRSAGNMTPAEELIKEYLEKNYHDECDFGKAADSIYKYLKARAVIIDENIAHEIFKNYFAAVCIYNKIYEITEDEVMERYIQFKNDDQKYLNAWCNKRFSIANEIWNNIAVDLLYKLDYEIHTICSKKHMNEENLNYNVFNQTLIKVLKEKGFNDEVIKIIDNLINKNSFHYNEFIKKYI